MLAAIKVNMSGSGNKVNRATYNISSKRVTRNFLEVSRCRRAKQRQRNVQKSALHVQSSFFCFFRSGRRLVSITRFYILFQQTIDINESFPFSPG